MWLSQDDSNQSVVIDAEPETVWEAITDEDRRREWLDDDRPIDIETVEEGRRLVWWWGDEGGYSRVEVELVPAVSGTRVIVTETFPLHALTGFARAAALA